MPLGPPPLPPLDPLIGRRLGERYIVRALIGRGGFGAVYRAEQIAVARTVAIKVIHPKRAQNDGLRRRFAREASAMAAVSHPCVVSLLDQGIEPDGLMFMALEYVDGRPLSDVLRGAGPMSPSRAVDLIRQVVAGVAEAHRLGVVHRDLKPANIMVVRDAIGVERVKVLDFGIAKLLVDPTGEATREGLMLGTPKYVSPEQIRARGVGPWSDQYGIGALLFHLLAGHPPFRAPSVPEVLAMHLREPAPRLGPSVPPDLAALVERCMAKRPADRFRDLQALARALDRTADRLAPWLRATERMRLGETTIRDWPSILAEIIPPPPAAETPPPIDVERTAHSDVGQPSVVAGALEDVPRPPGIGRGPRRAALALAIGVLAWAMSEPGAPIDAPRTDPPAALHPHDPSPPAALAATGTRLEGASISADAAALPVSRLDAGPPLDSGPPDAHIYAALDMDRPAEQPPAEAAPVKRRRAPRRRRPPPAPRAVDAAVPLPDASAVVIEQPPADRLLDAGPPPDAASVVTEHPPADRLLDAGPPPDAAQAAPDEAPAAKPPSSLRLNWLDTAPEDP